MGLTQAQINALIAGMAGPAEDEARAQARAQAVKSVKTYDFRRPDKFSKDQLRTLTSIHENFGRLAGARLSGRLRFAVHPLEIKLTETSQMIYKEYLLGLDLPTMLVTLRAPQLPGNMLMDIDLALLLAFIDRLLGGQGLLPAERREPTKLIEKPLILRFIDEIVESMKEAWESVAEITPFLPVEPDFTPAMLQIAAPSDVVVLLSFEVRYEVDMGGVAPIPQVARMSLCIPHDVLAPVLPLLSATNWYAKAEKTVDEAARTEIEASLQNVEIPVTAILGGVELTVDELAGLKPGDIIRFAERIDQPVRLSVMDKAMAWAQPGRVGDHVAMRLLTPLQQLMEA